MQVLVTRIGKNLKDPKEPEPTALLYPILQGGTEEELLFPPLTNPSSHCGPLLSLHLGPMHQKGGLQKILSIGQPCLWWGQ